MRTLGLIACLALAWPASVSAQDKAAKAGPGHKFGLKEAPAKQAGTLRLAAYNLENLYDTNDDPELSGEWEDMNMQVPEDRLQALAAAIKALDADILCVEEVESLEALQWFRDGYLKGLGYDHAAALDGGYYRGVEQGLLSRLPIKSAEVFKEESLADVKRTGDGWAKPEAGKEPTRFQRSPLKAVVELPTGAELTVFVVHLKASGGAENQAQREAESLQVREWIEGIVKKDPEADIAILGDFNASPSERPYALQVKGSKNGDGEGIMQGAYDFRSPVVKGRDAFVTHCSGRSIDYILLSEDFAKDCVPGSFFVLGTLYGGDEQQAAMRKWLAGNRQGPEPEKPKGYASDHYPIAIDFKPEPGPAGKPEPAPKKVKSPRPAGE